MSKWMWINIMLTLSLLFIFSLPCYSIPQWEAGETVTTRGSIGDDYYAAGGTVDIDADINGDAVVAGGDLFIGHRVSGDVISAGGSLNISGEILDDVRVAGGDIMISSNINDDLLAAGGAIRISSGTSVGGNAWLAGGDVLVAGTINQDLLVGAGKVKISGTIHGDVVIEGEKIQILEGAQIEGDLRYKSPGEAEIHSGARIVGNVTYDQVEWDHPHKAFGVFFSFTLVVAAMILFQLFPGFTLSAANEINRNPWKSLGVGFALLVLTPVLSILLMSIVLGIWVGLSLFALYFISLLVGYLISCFFLSDWAAKLLHKEITTTGLRFLFVALVIVSLSLVQLIPVIGGLTSFALLLLGLGAGILQIQFVYAQSNRI